MDEENLDIKLPQNIYTKIMRNTRVNCSLHQQQQIQESQQLFKVPGANKYKIEQHKCIGMAGRLTSIGSCVKLMRKQLTPAPNQYNSNQSFNFVKAKLPSFVIPNQKRFAENQNSKDNNVGPGQYEQKTLYNNRDLKKRGFTIGNQFHRQQASSLQNTSSKTKYSKKLSSKSDTSDQTNEN